MSARLHAIPAETLITTAKKHARLGVAACDLYRKLKTLLLANGRWPEGAEMSVRSLR